MAVIEVNGVELELDMLDADVVERYENLNKDLVEKIQEPTQYDGLSTAEGMRLQCRMINTFFDKLFGDGTAKRIFGEGYRLDDRLDAFGKVSQMTADIDKHVSAIKNKYGIDRVEERENRKQRRQKEKHSRNKYVYRNGKR